MKTAELLVGAGFVFLLSACGQPDTDAATGLTEGSDSAEMAEEDGFTLQQMNEMAAWQQAADSAETETGVTAFDRIKEKGLDWIELWKKDGEWVIYEECPYGAGGLYFEENGAWFEFSGGGDANSHDIESVEQTSEGILLTFIHALTGDHITTTLTFPEDHILVMRDGDSESRFVLSSCSDRVKTFTEPCDESE